MKSKLIAIVMAVCIIFPCLSWGASPAFAFAEETTVDVSNYTDVLDDLQKDETFDVAEYPVKTGDYSLEVIQIAESSDGELFVYVYQHSVDTRCLATSIRFSTSLGNNAIWNDYELKLLNSNETLAKYLVLDFEVKKDIQRFYDITAIYRKWIAGYDDEALGGNTVDEFAITVGKLFTAVTYEGVTSYTVEVAEFIEITAQYTGNLVYDEGVFINNVLLGKSSSVVSHYVAFSTNLRVDQIEEADVGFIYTNWMIEEYMYEIALSQGWDWAQVDFEEPQKKEVTVKAEKATASSGGAVSTHNYSWNRIQSVQDFITDPSIPGQLDAEVVRDLQKCQWVLRFYETDINTEQSGFVVKVKKTGTYVSDVTILRLKYWTNGKLYNVGVVSNKQTGSGYDNITGWDLFLKNWNDFWDSVTNFFTEYWWVFAIIGGVIVLGILAYFLKPFGGAIQAVLKYIGLTIYYIISAPARLVVWIGEKIKERRDAKG